MESGFPFITFGDSDKVVCMSEINFGIDTTFLGSIKEISNEWKWILVLLGDSVKSTEIHAESERTILLLNE